jgi:hypothetical protein
MMDCKSHVWSSCISLSEGRTFKVHKILLLLINYDGHEELDVDVNFNICDGTILCRRNG